MSARIATIPSTTIISISEKPRSRIPMSGVSQPTSPGDAGGHGGALPSAPAHAISSSAARPAPSISASAPAIMRAACAYDDWSSNAARSDASRRALTFLNGSTRATPSAAARRALSGWSKATGTMSCGRAGAHRLRERADAGLVHDRSRAREGARVGKVRKCPHALGQPLRRDGAGHQDRAPSSRCAAAAALSQKSPAIQTADDPSANTIGGSPSPRKRSRSFRIPASGVAPSYIGAPQTRRFAGQSGWGLGELRIEERQVEERGKLSLEHRQVLRRRQPELAAEVPQRRLPRAHGELDQIEDESVGARPRLRSLRSHAAPAMTGGSQHDMKLSGDSTVATQGSPRTCATSGSVTVSGCEIKQIGAVRGPREVLVGGTQVRHDELAHQALGPATDVEEPRHQLLVVADVGSARAHRRELDAGHLDGCAMVLGGGDHRAMPALGQRAGDGDVRVKIAERAGSREEEAAQASRRPAPCRRDERDAVRPAVRRGRSRRTEWSRSAKHHHAAGRYLSQSRFRNRRSGSTRAFSATNACASGYARSNWARVASSRYGR